MFIPTKLFDSFSDKERYYYTSLRYKTIQVRKRCLGMMKKCRFHYRYPFYSCIDKNYSELIKLIKLYFGNYNTFIAATTLEGMLITQNNYKQFFEYMKQKTGMDSWFQAFEREYSKFDEVDQLNFLRLIYNGKSDYILKSKQIIQFNPNIPPIIKSIIENGVVSKTSGWMSEWLEYYFCSIYKISIDKDSFNKFKEMISDRSERQKVALEFVNDFNEIYKLIKMIAKNNG